MKIKLLFDVEQLSTNGLKGTGIVRVCDVLLHLLMHNPMLDIYLIVTTKSGDIKKYLLAKGLYETFKDKIVYMPKLLTTTKNRKKHHVWRSKIITFLYKFKYKRILQKFDAYFSPFSPIPPMVYESKLRTYLIVHDLIPIYFPQDCCETFIQKFTDWINRSHPDAYFCVSEFTKEDLHRYKPESAKIPAHIIYLGADAKFKPCDDLDKIANVKDKYHIKTKKYFLTVSEITARKNFVHLLQSFAEFMKNTNASDISLVLVGPLREGYTDVASQIKDLEHYQDKIIQTGYVDDNDLPILYNGATAFIYPSLYEGFGLPVLEAMQCGTPVICADNSSLPEVGGEAPLYINGYDCKQTADALQKIYAQPELASKMKQLGLKQAQNFDWQKTADTIANVISGKI